MFEKKGYQGIRTKMMIFYFIFFPKQTRAKCIQINHAKRLLGLLFILLIISFYLNHLKFLLVAFDSTEEDSPLFFRASFCLLSRKTVWKFFGGKHALCNDWVMLSKLINYIWWRRSTQILTKLTVYKLEFYRQKRVVCFFQDSLTWNKDDTISISLSRGGGIIWLFCQKKWRQKFILVVRCWENSTICSTDLSITKKFKVEMI